MQQIRPPKFDDEIIFDIFLEILTFDLKSAIARIAFKDYKNKLQHSKKENMRHV